MRADPVGGHGPNRAGVQRDLPKAVPIPIGWPITPLSLALVGAPGTVATGSITVENTGTGTLTITCGVPTAGFTMTSAPAATVAPGASTAIGLSCTTPATRKVM